MESKYKNRFKRDLSRKFVGEFHSLSSLQNKLASCRRGLFIFTIMSLMLQSFTYGRPTFDGIYLDVDTKGNEKDLSKCWKNF